MQNTRLNLPFRTSADTEGEVQRVLAKLESNGKDLTISRLVANSSAVFRPFIQIASNLTYRSPLPPKDREVAVLYLAAIRGAEYEWKQHVPISRGIGITDAQREALSSGMPKDLSLFSASEQLALELVGQIVESDAVTPRTWEKACALWGLEAAFDLILAAGFWGGFVPIVMKAVGLRDPRDP